MIHIYFKKPPNKDRYIYGDRFILSIFRHILRGKKTSGVEKVFTNLCKSFDEIGISYRKNSDFAKIKSTDQIIVFGIGKHALEGYKQPNRLIAGIALMNHPLEWPNITTEYPIAKYLQHSDWAKDIYTPYFGEKIADTWFSGIDTNLWKPLEKNKKTEILIYNKIRWDSSFWDENLRHPILDFLIENTISFKEIVYGSYKESDYQALLGECKGMIFLCEHESQGFACCEAMASGVPILAWNQGYCLDPNFINWNDGKPLPATSIPFFDSRCGSSFIDFKDFEGKITKFLKGLNENTYNPREYILENLTLAKSGERMIEIINEVYHA